MSPLFHSQSDRMAKSGQPIEVRGASESSTPENAIAVVGMAAHFPGAANVEQFWRNLRDGV